MGLVPRDRPLEDGYPFSHARSLSQTEASVKGGCSMDGLVHGISIPLPVNFVQQEVLDAVSDSNFDHGDGT